jgi:hypothetical protein
MRQVLEHWKQARGERAMPQRRQFDATTVPVHLLPNIVIAEIVGTRFRLRLVGTEIVNRLGYEPTGKFLDEAFAGEHGTALNTVASRTLNAKQPLLAELTNKFPNGEVRQHLQLLLPFSENDRTVSHIVSVVAYLARRPTRTFRQMMPEGVRSGLTIIAEGWGNVVSSERLFSHAAAPVRTAA